MELVYRGVKYQTNNLRFHPLKTKKRSLSKRNTSETAIAYKFPLIQYCKQLFGNRGSIIFSPELFWHQHQSQFLEGCWRLSMVEQLESSWEVTLKMEFAQALKKKTPSKLKYRGVTYYR